MPTWPEALDEADRCYRTMLELGSSAVFEGTAFGLSSVVAAAKNDWPRAVEHRQRGR